METLGSATRSRGSTSGKSRAVHGFTHSFIEKVPLEVLSGLMKSFFVPIIQTRATCFRDTFVAGIS